MKSSQLGMIAVFTVILAALTTGCAPERGPAKVLGNGDSNPNADEARASSTGSLAADYDCPLRPNVTPTSDFNFGSESNFTVCRAKTKSQRFLIEKSVSSNKTRFCAYPMKATGSSLVLVDFAKCFDLANNAAELEFNSNEISQMIIVYYGDSDAMNRCLSGSSACPTYSQGFIQ
jgi:hypothetical protein